MRLYKDTKVMVCSPNGDINYFDIVVGDLQRKCINVSTIFISNPPRWRNPNVNKSNESKLPLKEAKNK